MTALLHANTSNDVHNFDEQDKDSHYSEILPIAGLLTIALYIGCHLGPKLIDYAYEEYGCGLDYPEDFI